jgi:hypothetical protein
MDDRNRSSEDGNPTPIPTPDPNSDQGSTGGEADSDKSHGDETKTDEPRGGRQEG